MKISRINNRKAKRVLSHIEELLEGLGTPDDMLWLNHYCNGREQGFALSDRLCTLKVVWSEARGSDNIVVYAGEFADFENNTNIPHADAYTRGSKEFKFYQEREAAQHIVDFLVVIKGS